VQHVNPGLQPENILTFNLSLPDVRYSSEKQVRFYRDLMARIRSLPGVQSASAVMPLPLSGDRMGISFQIEGRPVAPRDEPSADVSSPKRIISAPWVSRLSKAGILKIVTSTLRRRS
jgi:hypothetical protein